MQNEKTIASLSNRPPGRCLCFGGSFNPIHYGHLRCARAAAEVGGFDSILLIPSAQPPHKTSKIDLASPVDRLAMTRLAVADQSSGGTRNPPFFVDDLELQRSGPSFTIDTAAELRQRGWDQVVWLIGADMLNSLPSWHRAEELIDQVKFLILARPGVDLNWAGLPPRFREKLAGNVVPAPLVDISATEIRRRVRERLPIEHLTPPPVARYIAEHGLYR